MDAAEHFAHLLRVETDCFDVNQALQTGDAGFVLLDVRSPEAFAAGHVDGAINLPHRDISADALAPYPDDTEFVVYCAGPHCNGADKAGLALANLGRPVKKMIGGVTGWLDEGLPLVGSGRLSAVTATDRTTVKRLPDRGRYDTDTIYPIIDEALLCHLAISTDDGPVVLPTLHARDGDQLVLHGSAAAAILRRARDTQVSVAISHIDGLVLARTGLHHSVNYRSVVVFGVPTEVTDLEEKARLLNLLTDAIVPGRMAELRDHTEKELRSTLVLTLPLDEASAKVRTGGPSDDEEDYARPLWAGVIPINTTFGPPETDPLSRVDVPVPDYVANYSR